VTDPCRSHIPLNAPHLPDRRRQPVGRHLHLPERIEGEACREVTRENREGIDRSVVGRQPPGAEVRPQHRRHAGASTAHIVRVHPIVVNEQVGLEKLQRHACHHHRVRPVRATARLVARRHQHRAKALSAA
jgi:hypothetical protein